jgi:hypothetical protein
MNLLDVLMNANGGAAVDQLSGQFGLSREQTTSAVENLLPALAGGIQRNISQGGLTDLVGALNSGRHQQYLDNPAALSSQEAQSDGNGILGHVLGSKDVSRQVAAQAAGRTGISESVLKQMLPAVASLAMGALSRQQGTGGAGILGMLTPLLDRNKDGSVLDDVLGFFRKS